MNLSDAIVQVPKLVGFSEDLVDGSLASLPVGGRIFLLRKGVITRVPSAQPRREILCAVSAGGHTSYTEYAGIAADFRWPGTGRRATGERSPKI